MTDHPITPPAELVQAWSDEALTVSGMFEVKVKFATYAAQWGADQELEACCEWLKQQTLCGHRDLIPSFHTARRPKPPSLKEQALEMLEITRKGGHIGSNAAGTIRRALEQLPE